MRHEITRTKAGTAAVAAALALAVAGTLMPPNTPALAAGEEAAGRYTMSPTDDGFVRLDTQTGRMSLCRRSDGGWACEPMADGSSTIGGNDSTDVAELRRENADLKAEIARLEGMLGLRDGTPGAGGEGKPPAERREFSLPTEKQVDEALDYFANILKKFQDRLKDLEQGTRKAPEDERAL